ncbi:hypothetical protein N9M90_04545 [Alphaproteobacteria bacterium]|nr:hypothetical protein [Alphaproteobacteria bacterium]
MGTVDLDFTEFNKVVNDVMISKMEDKELLQTLEDQAGGPLKCARLLAVDYTGSYASWKAGRKKIPRYIISSVKAHLKLVD